MPRKKCPTQDELDGLIYALNSPSMDSFMKEKQRPKKRKRRTDLSRSEEIIEKLEKQAYEDTREAYRIMQEWGETRIEAAKNYAIHYSRGIAVCDRCFHTYTAILVDHVYHVYQPSVEEAHNQKYLEILTNKAHRELLGSNKIRSLLERDFPFEG